MVSERVVQLGRRFPVTRGTPCGTILILDVLGLALEPALQRRLELGAMRAGIGEELDHLDLLARTRLLRRVDEPCTLFPPPAAASETAATRARPRIKATTRWNRFAGLISSPVDLAQQLGALFQRFASGSFTLITALSILFSFSAARALSRSCAIAVRPEPHAVPDAVVGQRGGLDLGLQACQRQPRLQVVRVGRALEGTGLKVVHDARGRARRGALAHVLVRYDLFLAGKDRVEVQTRLAALSVYRPVRSRVA